MLSVMGLHPLDATIVLLSLLGVIAIGVWVSRGVKQESDFFVSGRSMGAWLQFFLNFGQATDSNGAPTIATEVYRQGVGGMWIGFQTLFITPFIWFTSIWFRRTRLTTGPELFVDRFGSRKLALFYAWFSVLTIPLTLGLGNIISYKVAAAMMTKSPAEYTQHDRDMTAAFAEYEKLRGRYTDGSLSGAELEHYNRLSDMAKRKQIASSVSWIQPAPFYIVYTLIVAVYIMLGGIKAAAVTDAFQGLLIIIFSIVMIPVGLSRVGGFAGLHQLVPEHKFLLFGSESMSEYAWHSILAIVVASLVTFGQPGGPANAAARDEKAIRLGMLSGLFLKRFVMIMWMLCGLIAVALLPGGLSDPDNVWGALASRLLGPGLMGLMISGMLLGHMPAVGTAAVNFSAMFTRDLYQPLIRGKSEKHYLFIAKAAIFGVLVIGAIFAVFFSDVISLLSALITFGAYFGAAGFLMYFWRRLTAPAVGIGAVTWVILMTVVAWIMPHVSWFAQQPSLLMQTQEQVANVRAAATLDDVQAGRADKIGQVLTRQHVVQSRPLFFDKIARSDPQNPNSPMEGIGRFHVENYIAWKLGIPLNRFGPATLTTTRWLVAGILPFVMLMVLSLLTQRHTAEKQRLDRFYAKMKTPIAPTLELDAVAVAEAQANPEAMEKLKLFPGTSWEFTKWSTIDYLGFFGCWACVLGILAFLYVLTRIGASN